MAIKYIPLEDCRYFHRFAARGFVCINGWLQAVAASAVAASGAAVDAASALPFLLTGADAGFPSGVQPSGVLD